MRRIHYLVILQQQNLQPAITILLLLLLFFLFLVRIFMYLLLPEYKEGVRQDPIVNKNAACRGPPPHESTTRMTSNSKENGKKLARRSSSTKKKPTSLENNLCPFKIRPLKLEEGENWVVKKMHAKQQYQPQPHESTRQE